MRYPDSTPTPGARVTISVDPIHPASPAGVPVYPDGVTPDPGYLCVDGTPSCGSTLSGLTTNQSGNVRVWYWAPGVVSPTDPDTADGQPSATVAGVSEADHAPLKPNIYASAVKSGACTPHGCSLWYGKYKQPFDVYEHLLYFKTASITTDQDSALAAWADELTFCHGANLGPSACLAQWISAHTTWKTVLAVLTGFVGGIATEEDAGAYLLEQLEASEHVNKVGETMQELSKPEQLRIGMLAMFISAFGLLPSGLGVPDAHNGDDKVHIGERFDEAVLEVMQDFAQKVDFFERTDAKSIPTSWTLGIREISFCDGGYCGSEYDRGTHAYLYFTLSSNRSPESSQFYQSFVIPYTPSTWVAYQPGLITG
ncbi:MAG TPA: hypothetical protein VK425_00315 [Acidimicrobiales bacterium]|nr:hypothetical protein [Acidimicrobiales bacterium]